MKPIRRTRTDTTQGDIVKALERCGWAVYMIGWPVDLLLYKPSKGFRLLECKTPGNKAGNPKLDKRQVEQAEFCRKTNTPYVTNSEQAIQAVEAYERSHE